MRNSFEDFFAKKMKEDEKTWPFTSFFLSVRIAISFLFITFAR